MPEPAAQRQQKHRSPIGDDGHQPGRPVPPPSEPGPGRGGAGNAAAERLVTQVRHRLGRPVPPEWTTALRAVPRDVFLPGTVWLRDGEGGYEVCDRAAHAERWWAAASADEPVVTRLDTEPDGWQRPVSSLSAPSTVVRMLDSLALRDGARVLEIGTGVGFTAALLAHRLGDANVISLELDADLVETARGNLKLLGRGPAVECADGALGWPDGGPYDAVFATCSVRRVPGAWLEQTRPGGRIVVPWSTAWCAFGTVTLTRRDGGGADGRFTSGGSYMPLLDAGDAGPGRVDEPPRVSRTGLSPWAVAGEDYTAQFAVGACVPGVRHVWDGDPEPKGVRVRLWLEEEAGGSWATVDVRDGSVGFVVAQYGPRSLWDEVETAWHWWDHHGRPTPDRFGITAARDGHTLWLDTPATPCPHAAA
ncbi:methyltransferase domain-containing protein [Streptomyces sp. NPDC049881]|uniref:methyltransferase domain-containing protein n=1 Tax=Streptomyces sp. NPDC049881 TaxID=3155778 RepID=UPI00343D38A1